MKNDKPTTTTAAGSDKKVWDEALGEEIRNRLEYRSQRAVFMVTKQHRDRVLKGRDCIMQYLCKHHSP